ncbi:MAG: helix-turn-helix domain-containing protein [Candidatus Gastranaerophilales bacterium]|nr:helix-turn-helix domain-containing protein [Candidatus Gastranaerophilales bacterium]
MNGNDINLIFGSSVREHRKARGFTQEKLAELVGVDKNTINRIETGVSFVKSETYAKICNVFNIHPSVLMAKRQDMLLKEHINYRTEINYLLQTLSQEKLVDIYNIIRVLNR